MFAALLVATCLACSKDDDAAVDPGNTNADGSVNIDSVSFASAAPEGDTATAADEEDLLANSTFSSVVSIQFGSTVTVTNPLAGKRVRKKLQRQKIQTYAQRREYNQCGGSGY
jgi:hypothetical protein